MRIVFTYIILAFLLISQVQAQDCLDGDDFDNFADCILEAIDACTTAVPTCEDDDAFRGFTVEHIMTHVEDSCCDKNTKKAMLKCIAKFKRIMKKGQKIFPVDARKIIKEEFSILKKYVKQNGTCTGYEDD